MEMGKCKKKKNEQREKQNCVLEGILIVQLKLHKATTWHNSLEDFLENLARKQYVLLLYLQIHKTKKRSGYTKPGVALFWKTTSHQNGLYHNNLFIQIREKIKGTHILARCLSFQKTAYFQPVLKQRLLSTCCNRLPILSFSQWAKIQTRNTELYLGNKSNKIPISTPFLMNNSKS